jgi:shikimate dehydrogenase
MEIKKEGYKLGLIGYPLEHSFSPDYFSNKFKNLGIDNSEYLAYPIENIELVKKIFNNGISGLNVTIPYKEQVIPFLDELSDEAFEINAVNTIKITEDRKVGYNTDVYGFEKSLKSMLGSDKIENALILGTGGASKAIKFVLNKMKIKFTIVSRNTKYLTYSQLTEDIIRENKLIINTTPLGMYPKIEECPNLPYFALSEKHFLYDLVYNPEKTLFLKKGELQKCNIKNGYEMLILQAEKSWEIWNQL